MSSSTAPSPSSPTPTDAVPVSLGLIVSSQATPGLAETLRTDLPRRLSERFPGIGWQVSVVVGEVAQPPADALDLLEATRDRMLDEDWDIAVALTHLPLQQGRHSYVEKVSAAHASGVVSLPALSVGGAASVESKTASAVLRMVCAVLGLDPDDDALTPGEIRTAAERARQLATDVEDRPDENQTSFAVRVIGGNARLLLGMVKANRPWRLALALSKSLTVALAAAALTLVTTDLWLLSAEYTPLQMILVAVVAVAAVTVALIVGAHLWERPRRAAEREQVTLFNAATTITVVLGVVVLHVAMFLLSLGGALLLVDPDVFYEVTGDPAVFLEYVKLAWLVAGLATIGGALGAGLEDDDAVRDAAYTRGS